MTNEEILRKAIDKAEKNGYKFPFDNGIIELGDTLYGEYTWVPRIIFSHDFAKAFWGDLMHYYHKEFNGICKCNDGNNTSTTSYCWQYHLQQMVLKTEPLKYLEKFLDKK